MQNVSKYSLYTDRKKLAELCLGEALFECMKQYSDRIAQYVVDTDENITYADLLKRSIRTAIKLQDDGITQKDIIAIFSHNHANSCVPLLAALFLGVRTVTFDSHQPRVDVVQLLNLIRPKIIFVAPKLIPKIESCLEDVNISAEIVVFGYGIYESFTEYLQPNSKEDDFKPTSIRDKSETATMLFTSGTTDVPKTACFSHSSILSLLKLDNSLFQPFVFLNYSSLYWSSATSMFMHCILVGGSRVICAEFDPTKTMSIVKKYKVSYLFLQPRRIKAFIDARPKKLEQDFLQLFIVSGNAVSIKVIEELRSILPNTMFMHLYGMTEFGIVALGKIGENLKQLKDPLSCGKFSPLLEGKIVDPCTGRKLGPYEKGEIQVKGESFMNGYYEMDSTPYFDSEGFYKTGDVGYFDEDNNLYLVDRIKEIFKYHGFHISPSLIERVVHSHPSVADAIVIGIPCVEGEVPMALVTLKEGHDVSSENIKEFVDERVDDVYKIRGGVKIVSKILLTVTDKPRRIQMRKLVLEGKI